MDNMPTTVAANGGTVNFGYDGESKRTIKTGPSGQTYYFSNEFELINNVETRYIFAGNLRVAKVTDTETVYYHKDHLNSLTVMTSAAGIAQGTNSYLPYGGDRVVSGISMGGYKFTDQKHDVETGLYNYDAMIYDPMVGVFASPDNIVPRWHVPSNLNRYSYFLNSPIISEDPTGHYAPGPGLKSGPAPASGDDDDSNNDADDAMPLDVDQILSEINTKDTIKVAETKPSDIKDALDIVQKGYDAKQAADNYSQQQQNEVDLAEEMLKGKKVTQTEVQQLAKTKSKAAKALSKKAGKFATKVWSLIYSRTLVKK